LFFACVPYVASFSGLSILIAPSVYSIVYVQWYILRKKNNVIYIILRIIRQTVNLNKVLIGILYYFHTSFIFSIHVYYFFNWILLHVFLSIHMSHLYVVIIRVNLLSLWLLLFLWSLCFPTCYIRFILGIVTSATTST